jgi:tRNA 2-thiouridine synthesizing protein A
MNSPKQQVDATGLNCPMPLLKLKQALNAVSAGEVVLLIASDPASKRDVLAFANITEQAVELEEKDNLYYYLVTKGDRP